MAKYRLQVDLEDNSIGWYVGNKGGGGVDDEKMGNLKQSLVLSM